MILIFGGAYQGKLEFAQEQFRERADAGSVRECTAECAEKMLMPDRSENAAAMFRGAYIITGLENFTWACCTEDPEQRVEAADIMRACKEEWQDKILIITDVSQGIVPIEARTRAFREMNGRLMLYLASEAEEVWRVFCGIGKRIR